MPGARSGKASTGNDLGLSCRPSHGRACAALGFCVPHPNTRTSRRDLLFHHYLAPREGGQRKCRTFLPLECFAPFAAPAPPWGRAKNPFRTEPATSAPPAQ